LYADTWHGCERRPKGVMFHSHPGLGEKKKERGREQEDFLFFFVLPYELLLVFEQKSSHGEES
jgi:hypothetical protein